MGFVRKALVSVVFVSVFLTRYLDIGRIVVDKDTTLSFEPNYPTFCYLIILMLSCFKKS